MATCRSSTSASRSQITVASGDAWGRDPAYRSSNESTKGRRRSNGWVHPSRDSSPRVPIVAARATSSSGGCIRVWEPAEVQSRCAKPASYGRSKRSPFPGIQAAARETLLNLRNFTARWKISPTEWRDAKQRAVIAAWIMRLFLLPVVEGGSDALPHPDRSPRLRKGFSNVSRHWWWAAKFAPLAEGVFHLAEDGPTAHGSGTPV